MAGPVKERSGQVKRAPASRGSGRAQGAPKGSSKGASAATAAAARQASQASGVPLRVGTPDLGHGLIVLFASLVFGGVMLIAAPGFVLLTLIGFVPMFALLMFDSEWVWTHFYCLAMMNLAGVVLAFGLLWHRGGDIVAALNLLSDPVTWLLMYGGAALGYGLAWSMPLMVQGLVEFDAMRRRTQIQKARAALKEEWSLPDD